MKRTLTIAAIVLSSVIAKGQEQPDYSKPRAYTPIYISDSAKPFLISLDTGQHKPLATFYGDGRIVIYGDTMELIKKMHADYVKELETLQMCRELYYNATK